MKIKYKTEEEKDSLIETYNTQGYILTGIDFHVDGNYLIFKEFNLDSYLDESVRPKRDKLLKETDHLMLYDNYSKLTAKEKSDFESYRQELRDITENINGNKVTWPQKPTIGSISEEE